MLYTSQAPVLNLRGRTVTSTSGLQDAFHQLGLSTKEAETKGKNSSDGRRIE